MTSFPVVCISAVVKTASSKKSIVSERSQAYFLRKQGFKVSQIMEIMIKSKNWVIKWFICGGTGSLETNAYGILQILSVCDVIVLKVAPFFF